MVGTTKRCIRKVLGKRQAEDEKLNTIFTSIEAAINSRPLTQDDGPGFRHQNVGELMVAGFGTRMWES